MLKVKKIYPWLSCVLLFIVFCSIGITGVQVKTNNTDSDESVLCNGFNINKDGYLICNGFNINKDGYLICNGFNINKDGYLILNVTNLFEYDLYNISFDIEFVGGIPFFKANAETDAFVEHVSSGETIELKSNDPIIKPKPIIRRPLFFGYYFLTIDGTQCMMYGLFFGYYIFY